MGKLRKIKKGEEGLNQLKEAVRGGSSDLYYDRMSDIIEDCLNMKDNSDHQDYLLHGYGRGGFVDSTITAIKKDGVYIRKNFHRVKKQGFKTGCLIDYTVISKGKDGRYEIMSISPRLHDGKRILEITTNVGLASEDYQEIDLSQLDVPKKQRNIFIKADRAMKIVDDVEKIYQINNKDKADPIVDHLLEYWDVTPEEIEGVVRRLGLSTRNIAQAIKDRATRTETELY